MIRVLIQSSWSDMGPHVWEIQPDHIDWPFFQAHTNVGDVLRLHTRSGQLECSYEILSKDPVHEP